MMNYRSGSDRSIGSLWFLVIQVIIQIGRLIRPVAVNIASTGTPHDNEHREKKPRRPRLWRHAALLSGIAAWCIPTFLGKPQYFFADPNQPHHVVLDDGTTLDLRAGTVVMVQRLPTECRIVLISGEALFNVTHNASRHVDVFAGNALIRVLGTQFDVALKHDTTRLIVIDGAVNMARIARTGLSADTNVAGNYLSRGQSIEVDSDTSQPLVAKPIDLKDMKSTVAWNVRYFPVVPLEEIVAEVNRYNVQQKITIDARLSKALLVGTFPMSDPQAFVGKLRTDHPEISATEGPDGDISLTYSADSSD